MKEILAVGLGGCVGSVLRFKTGALLLHAFPDSKFPLGTFAVNIVGCLLIGVIAAILERASAYNAELRLLLITGFLGGFTTFSAFGLETLNLFRSGNVSLGVLNIALSVGAGLLAVWGGLKLAGTPGI